jgi:protein JSN1
VGPIRIGFARVPTKSPTIGSTEDAEAAPGSKLTEQLATVNGAAAVSTETQVSAEGGGLENYRSQLVVDLVKAGVHEQVLEKGLANGGEVTEQQMIMQVLSANREEDGDIKAAAGAFIGRCVTFYLITEPRAPATYYSAIPLITERPQRRFDSVRLKDLRKRLDSSALSVEEVDAITIDLMEDTAEVSAMLHA